MIILFHIISEENTKLIFTNLNPSIFRRIRHAWMTDKFFPWLKLFAREYRWFLPFIHSLSFCVWLKIEPYFEQSKAISLRANHARSHTILQLTNAFSKTILLVFLFCLYLKKLSLTRGQTFRLKIFQLVKIATPWLRKIEMQIKINVFLNCSYM